MKLSTVLDKIDSGDIALPEFQRGYVWNRDQVRALFTSLYRKLPVGGLLVWETKAAGAPTRGDGGGGLGMVKLLLDGQQRVTTQYGVIRGRPPRFFDGDTNTFLGLHFHMQTEEFSFYKPTIMAKDAKLRREQIGTIAHHDAFATAKIAAFNGRNNPPTYIWGEIASQLGKEGLFRPFWENGAKAPDERDWIKLFEGDEPILILLDEMPPYFHYYSTQTLGHGTVRYLKADGTA